MTVIKILSRLYVRDIDKAISYYKNIMGQKVTKRFSYPEKNLELAQMDDILIIAGPEEALLPFVQTKATVIVDDIHECRSILIQSGAEVIRDIKQVPTGYNFTVKHPDGMIFEYVQHI